MSPFSTAAANRATTSRSRFDSGSGRVRGAEASPQRRPGPLKRAFGGGLRAVQHGGHLADPVAEHVAQHQHATLPGWQMLESGDEREGDRLGCFVPRLRPERDVLDPAEQSGYGSSHSGSLTRWAWAAGPSAGTPSGDGPDRGTCSGTGWWRCGTARRGAKPAPRTGRAHATPPTRSPGAGPPHRGVIRRSGSSGPADHAGTARPGPGTRPRHRPEPVPAPGQSRLSHSHRQLLTPLSAESDRSVPLSSPPVSSQPDHDD